MPLSFDLTDAEKRYLCKQAKSAIESALANDTKAAPLSPEEAALGDSAVLQRNLGSFVTLEEKGHLRGCIGTIVGREPLWLNVWNMARQAAFHDPRFYPVTAAEWPDCEFEISVLDEPTLCPTPEEIEIGRDGLILQYQGHSGVFLPQVPVEQGWNRQQYLERLCQKANLPQGSWKKPGAMLYWFQALVFQPQSAEGK